MSTMPPTSTSVLCWPKRLLTADDLRRHLTSQRELQVMPRTVITPLAADELRAKGVRVLWQKSSTGESKASRWFYAQEKHDANIAGVIQALERDGVILTPFEVNGKTWIIAFAQKIVEAKAGGIALVSETASVVCIANKVAGIRAASVANAMEHARISEALGANLVAIDASGKTFFELRALLKAIAGTTPNCPETLAAILQELDGHAHR
jgi:hypothetical protein